VARFIGARSDREVVFTKNATEALNLVAKAWGRAHLKAGDPVVITELEHHANIVPWHQLVSEIGIELRWIPVGPDGHLDLTDLDRLVDGARVVSFAAMSNVLGTINPIERLVQVAHDAGAIAVVDASQYVPHLPTDVRAWGADFAAFTGHKMLGPTGIGVLWGTEAILDDTPPFLTGGEMILNVTKEGFIPNELPWKFEAGTPPIAEAVGLGAAVDYLTGLGMEAVRTHEVALTGYALRSLTERFGGDLVIHGPSEPAERGGVMSFTYRDLHPHDLTQVFDERGVCVRAGHHCAKPLMKELGVAATARASLYVYNDESDVDALGDAIVAAADFFGS
jgi:cysteine desulfurase/selenocysteine lyase